MMHLTSSRIQASERDRDGHAARAALRRRADAVAADPVTAALLHHARGGPDALAHTLSLSRGAARADLVQRLQSAYGNARVAGLIRRQPAPAPAAAQPVLRPGASGPAVEQLQSTLNAMGAAPPVAVDGKFGPATRAAVVAFQQSHALAPDGVAGPKTWAALGGPAPAVAPGVVVGGETAQAEAKADYAVGAAHYKAGRYDQALPYFQRVYSLPEADRKLRNSSVNGIAACYQRLGQKQKAIAAWEDLLSLPGVPEGWRLSALERLRELRTGEPMKASKDVTPPPAEKRAAADKTATAELLLSVACGQSGDYQGALDHARIAYGLEAASAHLRMRAAFFMGLSHQRLKQLPEAIDLFTETLGFPEPAFGQSAPGLPGLPRRLVLNCLRDARSGRTALSDKPDAMPLDEQDKRLAESKLLFRSGHYAQSAAVLQTVYSATQDLQRRATAALNIGRCYLRLGDFDRAASLFQEVLQYPSLSSKGHAMLEEQLREARNREVGLHIKPGEPAQPAPPGAPLELFKAEVYFETAADNMASRGETTLQEFAKLLNERHAAEPQLAITVYVVGHSSSRWRSAATEEQRDELNLDLSRKRAERVDLRLQKELQPGTVAATSVDATGDQDAEKAGVTVQDNTWFFRSVTLAATATVQPAPATKPPTP